MIIKFVPFTVKLSQTDTLKTVQNQQILLDITAIGDITHCAPTHLKCPGKMYFKCLTVVYIVHMKLSPGEFKWSMGNK